LLREVLEGGDSVEGEWLARWMWRGGVELAQFGSLYGFKKREGIVFVE